MNWLKENWFIITTLFLVGFLLGSLMWVFGIKETSHSIGGFSVFVALVVFLYNKKRDITIEVIDQISFFRKEIIASQDDLTRKIRAEKGENYLFKRVKLDTPTIEYTKNNFPEESAEQAQMIKELNILSQETLLLNMLEELSLRILHFGTINHRAIVSIKLPFVELVEIHAIALVFQREIASGLPTYSSILTVYDVWKDEVDRRPLEERKREVLRRLEK